MSGVRKHIGALEREFLCIDSPNPAVARAGLKLCYWYQRTREENGRFARDTKTDANLFYTGLIVCVAWIDNARSVGVSRCNPRDQFNKQVGRSISLGRALKGGNPDIIKPREFLYRLGAPWSLWHEEKPDQWPDGEIICG